MRHFVVLGFAGKSNNEKGIILYLGSDRGEALKKVNKGGGVYERREMHELAAPYLRRFLPAEEVAEAKAEEEAKIRAEEEARAEAEEEARAEKQVMEQALEAANKRILELEEDNGTLAEENVRACGDLEEAGKTITELQDKVAELEQEIAALEQAAEKEAKPAAKPSGKK